MAAVLKTCEGAMPHRREAEVADDEKLEAAIQDPIGKQAEAKTGVCY